MIADDTIAGGKFQYEGGSIVVPNGSGHGVKLDYDKLSGYKELHKRLGSYPYDQDPLRPGWTPIIPNESVGRSRRWAEDKQRSSIALPTRLDDD